MGLHSTARLPLYLIGDSSMSPEQRLIDTAVALYEDKKKYIYPPNTVPPLVMSQRFIRNLSASVHIDAYSHGKM